MWTCNIMQWYSLESPVVELKYVFPRLKAENDLSPTALVAGMTSNSFPRVEISPNTFLREIWRDCMKIAKSLMSNSKPHWFCWLRSKQKLSFLTWKNPNSRFTFSPLRNAHAVLQKHSYLWCWSFDLIGAPLKQLFISASTTYLKIAIIWD